MEDKKTELAINDLSSQLKDNRKKMDYFLNAAEKTFLHVLFIRIREKKKRASGSPEKGRVVVQEIVQLLRTTEKQFPLLTISGEQGLLVMIHEFHGLLEIFLDVNKLLNEAGEPRAEAVGMGAGFCLTGKNMDAENLSPAIRHAVYLSGLAEDNKLLIGSEIYEIQSMSLAANKRIQVQKCGNFRLPRSKSASQLYELRDSQKKMLFPSLSVFRKKFIYRLLPALLISAAVIFIPLFRLKIFQPVRVVLQGNLPAYCYIDYQFDKPLTSIWDPEGQGYLITQAILPGRHILSFDERHNIRCIQPVLIGDGDNIIKIQWQKYELPYTYIWMDYPKDKDLEKTEHYETQYTVFDHATLEPLTKDIVMDLSLRAMRIKPNLVQILLKWELKENNRLLSQGGRTFETREDFEEVNRGNDIIFKDDYVEYRLQISMDVGIVRAYILASYKDYKY